MDKRTFLKSMAAVAATQAVRLRRDSLTARLPALRLTPPWTLNVDVLESCSCPVFCQCFFTDKPPASMVMDHGHGHEQHVCEFNQAYRVNSGHAGSVRLDGARFWFAGNAGDDFDKPKLEWAVLTLDSQMTDEQRAALLTVIRHLRWYRPERWISYELADPAPMTWTADARGAHATLGGGAVAEVKLTTMAGMHEKPVMMMNMDYFGYPRNNGFVLMPSDVLAYRKGAHPFEYVAKGTNGLRTTLDMTADDFPA